MVDPKPDHNGDLSQGQLSECYRKYQYIQSDASGSQRLSRASLPAESSSTPSSTTGEANTKAPYLERTLNVD